MPVNNTSKTVTGARLKFGLVHNGKVDFVGIFNNCSFGFTLDAQPIYVLGAFAPVETVYTAQEPVRVTATGWRAVGSGAHAVAGLPHLQDLLQAEYIQLAVVDRQTGVTIAKITDVRCTSYDTTCNSRNPEEISVTFMGRLIEDESGENAERTDGDSGASVLP